MNANSNPLPTRLRPDLRWTPYSSDTLGLWVAQDPVNREFYFFSSIEKLVAQYIDGHHSIDSIVQKASRMDGSVTSNFVRQLVMRLDNASLLLNRNGLKTRVRPPFFVSWFVAVMSLIAWRVPLWDPSRLVQFFAFFGRILFHRWTILCVVITSLVTLFTLGQRWQEIVADAVAFQFSLQGDRLLLTAALLLAIKVLHELGHALACRTIGGECREMGIMFLFGAPCMYCDVSDIWRVPNRWHRILVSSAGMIIELIIAILASWVWFSATNPWLQGLAAQVMLLCSMMTILVNANPLLRYDGYYIFSDWLGIPNLSDQSREAWSRLWQSWLFRMEPIDFEGRYCGLVVFHVVSWCYRWFLLGILIWSVNEWLLQRRLGGFGSVLLLVLASATAANVAMGLRSLATIRNRRDSGRDGAIRWIPFTLLGIACSVAIWGVGTWKMPHSVLARAVIEPAEFTPLYARHAGVVQFVVKGGTSVVQGQLVAEVASPEIELELECAIGERSVSGVRLQQILKRTVDDPLAAQQVVELEQAIQGLEERIEKLRGERDLMRMIASITGLFVEDGRDRTLRDLAGRNLGERTPLSALASDRPALEQGAMLGRIISDERALVRAFVAEQEIGDCLVGANVRIRLDQFPGKTLQGRLTSISVESLDRTPKSLTGDGLFASAKADPATLKPERTTYSVSIELEPISSTVVWNGLATVRIESTPRTLAEECLLLFGKKMRSK